MRDNVCESPNEERIEAFRVVLEKLLDETSNITRELTLSEEFQGCSALQKDEQRDNNGACSLELVEDFEQFSLTNGIKLSSKQEGSGTAFVEEVNPEGISVSGSFLDGKPHGFFRILNKYGDLVFFGCFIRGVLHGPSWKSLVGGGFLLNPVNSNIDFTGSGIVYLYPDCQTVFRGSFEGGTMLSAQTSEVISTETSCCGLSQPVFKAFEKSSYCLDVSTSTHISKSPLLPDPYEGFFVFVSDSRIPGAGEGLFAKIPAAQGTVLAFYNGVRGPALHSSEESLESSPYRISLSRHTDMDIPNEFTSLDKYAASLAHKVCHSFTPNCDFDKYDHPRFGTVLSIVSQQSITAGEEITVNYKYDLNVAPAWYKKSWAMHQKKLRGMPSWQTVLSRGRRYRRTSSSMNTTKLPL